MAQIKLMASDLDHTLLDESGALPKDFFSLVEQLHTAGIEFVAASGRALYTLTDMFAPVSEQVSLVAENGGVIVHHGQRVYTRLIARADYLRLLHHTQAHIGGLPVLCALDTAYIGRDTAVHLPTLQRFFTNLTVVPDLADLDVPVAKYTVFLPGKETYQRYAPDYAKPLAGQFHVTIGGDYFVDIMDRRVNKGAALGELGRQLDITPAEMVTFGDNLNDSEMLALAGQSFIVEKALPELDRFATARIGSNQVGAVANKMVALLMAQHK